MEIYLSSESLSPNELTQEEHYFNRMDAAREYFGFKEKRNSDNPNLKSTYGVRHTIVKWSDEQTPRDKLLRPLDIIYVNNEKEGRSFWIPYVEYHIIKELLVINPNAHNLEVGFITGRQHYLGKFARQPTVSVSNMPGYQIWMECNPYSTHEDN